MKSRMIISLVIISMALAAITGGTLAWFTSQAELEENTFTAGTVIISADYQVEGEPIEIIDWNPGNSNDFKFTVTNDGTKAIYIRAQFDGEWGAAVHSVEGETAPDLNLLDVVTFGVTGTWSAEIDGWYYFEGSVDKDQIKDLDFTVTLDGPTTTNWYQGATYTLTVVFEAIQSSHEAAFDIWGVGYFDGVNPSVSEGWYDVSVSGGTWQAIIGGTTYTWVKVGNSGSWED